MTTPHKHASLLIAWANDRNLQFQFRAPDTKAWISAPLPCFNEAMEYRIKPKTLAMIAKEAWFSSKSDAMSVARWEATAEAVVKAYKEQQDAI